MAISTRSCLSLANVLLLFVSLLCIGEVQAQSPEFTQRVQHARTVLGSPEGDAYYKMFLSQLGNFVGGLMQRCFPRGTPADTPDFILVADVLPGEQLAKIDVQPRTKMTQCFAQGFSRASPPQPPASFGQEGVPVWIPMKITP
jgi:hypothetical protein